MSIFKRHRLVNFESAPTRVQVLPSSQRELRAMRGVQPVVPRVYLLSLATVESVTDPAEAIAVLNKQEREAWTSAKAPLRRRESLFGVYATKTLIARELGIRVQELVLRRDPKGKPRIFLPQGRSLEFNVSHTAGIIAVAFTRNGDIGVDIESRDSYSNMNIHSIARQYFLQSEVDVITTADRQLAFSEFFRMWTLKEAALKAVGAGLSAPLRSVDVAHRRVRYCISMKIDCTKPSLIHAWHWEVNPSGCHLAVACTAPARFPTIVDLTRDPQPLRFDPRGALFEPAPV